MRAHTQVRPYKFALVPKLNLGTQMQPKLRLVPFP